MHPAISVIIFTVLSGAGFGLIFVLGLGMPVADTQIVHILLISFALLLSIAGLISSTFHLGHPERAWRAFSQWRSSWLSREGVLSVLTLGLFTLYAVLWIFYGMRVSLLGIAVSLSALSTVFATAMIYAQMKTVPVWNTAWTPICYIAFSIGSGLCLLGAFAEAELSRAFANLICGAILMMWAAKMKWWKRAKDIEFSKTGSSTGSATGLDHLGEVRLLERPHSGENYLTKEMVHKIGRKHAEKLRRIAFIAGGFIPFGAGLSVLLLNLPNPILLIGFFSLLIGLFAERWLFFAEAKHSVSLYY